MQKNSFAIIFFKETFTKKKSTFWTPSTLLPFQTQIEFFAHVTQYEFTPYAEMNETGIRKAKTWENFKETL